MTIQDFRFERQLLKNRTATFEPSQAKERKLNELFSFRSGQVWQSEIPQPKIWGTMLVFRKFKLFPIIGLLGLLVTNAHAETPPFESCEQIRELIRAQTGLLPKSDTALLQKLGVRQECGFSAAEVYRAAYGDRPIAKVEGRDRRSKHQDDDDD